MFGFMLTFFSGFGQTFLVSLYVPEIATSFGISAGTFGSIYAIATLASAFFLAKAGSYIDKTNLKTFTFFVLGGLFLSLLTLSQATHVAVLILGIWGLRLTGQGLMGHTAVATMARYFDKTRGKAISFSSLGHPAGEALLPVIVAFTIYQIGWRTSFLASAIMVALILPIASHFLLNKRKEVLSPQSVTPEENKAQQPAFSQKEILKKHTFWLLAPNIFILAFLNTAVFFFQVPLGASKGWSPEWVAGSIGAFAIASASAMMIAGVLADRFSASRLFPFYMLPYLIGLILLLSFDSPWIYPVCLMLMGTSNGFGSTLNNAVQAEKFDVRYIGSVRSVFSAMILMSTALGPALFGMLLNDGITFHQILIFCILYLAVTIIYSFKILPGIVWKRVYLNFRETIRAPG